MTFLIIAALLNPFALIPYIISALIFGESSPDVIPEVTYNPTQSGSYTDPEAFLIDLIPVLEGIGLLPDSSASSWPETVELSELWLAEDLPALMEDVESIHRLRVQMHEPLQEDYFPYATVEVWVFSDAIGPSRAVFLLDSLHQETMVFKAPHRYLINGTWMIRLHTRAEMFRSVREEVEDSIRSVL
jgi:hypothetical protein